MEQKKYNTEEREIVDVELRERHLEEEGNIDSVCLVEHRFVDGVGIEGRRVAFVKGEYHYIGTLMTVPWPSIRCIRHCGKEKVKFRILQDDEHDS